MHSRLWALFCATSPLAPRTNRTRVMLGYLTDVTGMPGRQVRTDERLVRGWL